MAWVTFRYNPFTGDSVTLESKETDLKNVILDFYSLTDKKLIFKEAKCRVIINDIIMFPINYTHSVYENDRIDFVVTIGDDVIKIFIGAITFAIGAILFFTGVGAGLGMFLMSFGGSMALGGIIGLLTPDPQSAIDGMKNSPTYQWEGPQAIANQGVPIPVTYGILRTAPNIINTFIEGDEVEEMTYSDTGFTVSETIAEPVNTIVVCSDPPTPHSIYGISFELLANDYPADSDDGIPASYNVYYRPSSEVTWSEATYCTVETNNCTVELDLSDDPHQSFDVKIELVEGTVPSTTYYYNVRVMLITSLNGSDGSFLNILCSFGHGPVYKIDSVEVNNQPIGTFIRRAAKDVEIRYRTRIGTTDQSVIPFFQNGGSYVSASFPYLLKSDDDFQVISCRDFEDTIAFCINLTCLLFHTDEDDGIQSNSVEIHVRCSTEPNGSWVDLTGEDGVTVQASNTSAVNRSIYVSTPSAGSYYLRIDRSNTSHEGTVKNKSDIAISSITAYNGVAYVYPKISLLGLRIEASEKLSGSMPNITAIVTGKKITVPKLQNTSEETVQFGNCYYDNYAEVYRYFGYPLKNEDLTTTKDEVCAFIADDSEIGGIKSVSQWSDNPAWEYYDQLSDVTYGLGTKIGTSKISWSGVFDAGIWSDRLVRTGSAKIASTITTTFTDGSVTITGASYDTNEYKNYFITIESGSYAGQIRRISSNDADTLSTYEDWDDTPSSGTQISVFKMQKRNRCNFTFDQNYKAIDIYSKLFASFRLIPLWAGSEYTLLIENDRPKTDVLTMGNLLFAKGYSESIKFQKPTHYVSYFQNQNLKYRKDLHEYEDENFTSGDKEDRVTIDLIGITELWRIKRQLEFVRNKMQLSRYLEIEGQIDLIRCMPGDVVAVAHDVPGWGIASGRVSASGAMYVDLDTDVTITSGNTYDIIVRVGTTVVEKTVDVTTTLGGETEVTTNRIYVTEEWDDSPETYKSVYAIGSTITYKEYSIEAITRTPENLVKISLLEYDEDVYQDDEEYEPIEGDIYAFEFDAVEDLRPVVSNNVNAGLFRLDSHNDIILENTEEYDPYFEWDANDDDMPVE